jgi:hypothetical protein
MPSCPRCQADMDPEENVCPQCGHRLKEDVVYRADYEPQELLDLGLSPKFVEFVFLDPKPSKFRFRCEPRESGWPYYMPKDVDAVYPLWTSNADVTAVWKRRGKLEFVNLLHDDPDLTVVSRTEQGLLADLFRQLLENEDWGDADSALNRQREIAEAAGFNYLEELNEWCEQNGNAADFEDRWAKFVASIDRKPRPRRGKETPQ